MFFLSIQRHTTLFYVFREKKTPGIEEKSDYNVKEHCIIRGHLSAIIKRYGCSWVSLGFMYFIKT